MVSEHKKTPDISILIPVRNEEAIIQDCIKSVKKFIIPKGLSLEIIILDGMSEDSTVRIIKDIISEDSRIKLFLNPKQFQASAINIGLKKAKGEWIMRLDAHSIYPENYLKLCYETAIESKADNVGGLVIAQQNGKNYQASLIQALTTHRFGVGDSGFRVGMSAGETDTVPYGFFKKTVFKKIGYMDERLVRAQDYEFNRRLAAFGGLIYMNPKIHIYYYNQPTLYKFLKKQIFLEAPYNAYMWYLAPYTFTIRHGITAIFSMGVLFGIILSTLSLYVKYIFIAVMVLYFSLGLLSSVQQSIRYKKIWHLIALPFSFFLYHFLHGLGVISGVLKLLFKVAPVQKIKEPWSGYGLYRLKVRKK